MDAKPQRLPRVLPITATYGDENSVAGKPQVHQHHKSVGTTKNGLSTGGMNAAAKRTVFGDVSNTAHALVDPAPKDTGKTRIAILAPREKAIATGKEKNHQGGEAFSRPPQRSFGPSIAPLQATNVQMGPKPPAHTELPRLETFPKAVGFSVTKNATFVFSDEGSNNSKTLSDTSLKSGNSASKMDKQVKNPRHFKSQPVLRTEQRTEQQPVLRRTKSRHFASNPELLVDVDEDVTEAPYHDALENLASLSSLIEDQLQVNPVAQPVQDTGFSQQLNVGSEPQLAMVSDPPGPRLEQDAASVTTELDENWDDDEGDMYDDQEQGFTTAHSFRSYGDNTTGGVTTVLAPKVTAKVQKELEAARAFVNANTTEEQIEEEEWDTSMVAEYGEDIFEYLRKLETSAVLCPNPHYMDIQADVTWSMRAVLMDWLVQVHNRFGLLPETLFLAVNCIDRFLSVKVVSVSKLQLVGATAIFVAAKYEEINCPSVQEIVYMVDDGFTVEEILKAERFMLSMLDFELGWPGPMSFLRRISKADDYDIETRTLAKYFLEVTIMDERFVGSPPSYIAAGAHCLARMMLRKGEWTPAHTHYSGYTTSQLKPLVSLIFECLSDQCTHHWAVYDKYQGPRFKHASVFVRTELAKGYTLSFQNNPGWSSNRSLLEEFTTSMQFAVAGNSHILVPTGDSHILVPVHG